MEQQITSIRSGKETPELVAKLLSSAVDFGLHWWYWTRRDKALFMSSSLMALLSYTGSTENLDPEEVYSNIHPEDVIKNKKAINRLYRGEDELYEAEFRLRQDDGSWKWFYNRGRILERAEDGRPELIAGVSMDLSGQYYMLLSRMEDAERVYKSVFQSAYDRIALYTMDNKITLMNSAYHEMLGYSYDEFLKLDRSQLIHPDDRAEQMALVLDEFPGDPNKVYEYRARHKDGYYLYMSSRVVHIPTGKPGEYQALFITRDVTDVRNNMEELRLAKERAEENEKLKSAFLANMSHEIRTPMNSIVGFSGLLNTPGLDEAQRSHYVKRIISNSENLLALISDIIDLAKLESDQFPIIYGHLRLADLMGEMEQYARDEALRMGKKEVEIQVEMAAAECAMEIDQLRLSQVLKNLLNNALKFTDSGFVELSCEFTENERVRFAVKDSGIGIAPDDSELIFEQFRQLDGSNTRKFGGTGLGLAISKNLVEMMGGRIWVDSEKGAGACFMVELPLKPEKMVSVNDKEWKPPVHKVKNTENLDILVVDDEPDTLELFETLFKGKGHRVRYVNNGYEALRALEQHVLPDLIFMDVQMPVMSGVDTLRIIRERYRDVCVVAQSAFALIGDRKRFLDEGFDEYLPKPFTRDQLFSLLESVIGKK